MLKKGCGSSGSHFNPLGFTHGDINDAVRHVGGIFVYNFSLI